MTYYYYWSYDEHTDEFFAFIDDGSKQGKTLFTIDDTEEMCDYIATGKMKHIDDVDGLEDFLRDKGDLTQYDILLFREESAW